MRPDSSFIQQPIRSLQTMLQIIALVDERIPVVIPDGIYGPSTISAINRFQQLYDLPITGITDQQTWEMIVNVYELSEIEVNSAQPIEILIDKNEVLSAGQSNAYVYFLQVMLAQLSKFYPTINTPEITGIYDTNTADAVRYFQQAADLPQSGTVDKRTWKNIVHQFTLTEHESRRSNTP